MAFFIYQKFPLPSPRHRVDNQMILAATNRPKKPEPTLPSTSLADTASNIDQNNLRHSPTDTPHDPMPHKVLTVSLARLLLHLAARSTQSHFGRKEFPNPNKKKRIRCPSSRGRAKRSMNPWEQSSLIERTSISFLIGQYSPTQRNVRELK